MKEKLPVAIIIFGLIAAIFFFSSNSSLEDEIDAALKVKKTSDKKLEIYRDVDNHYGSASDQFYANKPIVVLRGSGSTEVIRIYWEKMGVIGLNASRNFDNLDASWGEIDGKWCPYTITSKISRGYETVLFTNKENNDRFEILVIVK